MKLMIFLSVLLNLAIVSLAALFILAREKDARYMFDYNFLSAEEKQLHGDAMKLLKEYPDKTKAELEGLMFDRGLKERYGDLKTAGEIQNLLVESTRVSIRMKAERNQEEQASIERFKMLRSEFPDFTRKLEEQQSGLALREKDFEDRKNNWERVFKEAETDKLIEDINKGKKAEMFIGQVTNLPVDVQVRILRELKGDRAADLFNLLPKDQQENVKRRRLNPLGNPDGGIGTPAQ